MPDREAGAGADELAVLLDAEAVEGAALGRGQDGLAKRRVFRLAGDTLARFGRENLRRPDGDQQGERSQRPDGSKRWMGKLS
jgi:hypothetical protein